MDSVIEIAVMHFPYAGIQQAFVASVLRLANFTHAKRDVAFAPMQRVLFRVTTNACRPGFIPIEEDDVIDGTARRSLNRQITGEYFDPELAVGPGDRQTVLQLGE